MYLSKYKQNLHVNGNQVISYTTHVATINHSTRQVVRHGWWSVTTSKHINYVASQLGYDVVDGPRDQQEGNREPEPMFKTVGFIASLAAIFAPGQEEGNAWKRRMLATQPGISFPSDWDQLSEAEKERRLNGAIEISQTI